MQGALQASATGTLTVADYGAIALTLAGLADGTTLPSGTPSITVTGALTGNLYFGVGATGTIAIKAAFGTIQSQTLTLVNQNGEYTFSATVPAPSAPGSYSVVVSATDNAPLAAGGTRAAVTAQLTFKVGAASQAAQVSISALDTQVPRGPDAGLALAADGGSGHGAAAGSTSLPSGAAAYTYALWLRPQAASGTALAVGALSTTKAAYGLNVGPTYLSHLWGGTGAADLVASTTAHLDGQWHLVAGTWDGTTRRLYLDGTVIAQDTPSGLAVAASPPITLASSGYKGTIARPRLWSRALSGTEVNGLWTDSVPLAGLAAEWLFADSPTTATTGTVSGTVLTLTGTVTAPDQPPTVARRARYSLTSTGNGLSAASSSGLPTTGAYTLGVWVKPSRYTQGTLIKLGSGSTALTVRLLSQAAGDRFDGVLVSHGSSDAGIAVTLPLLTQGRWHRLLVSYDGSTRTLYHNGLPTLTDSPQAPQLAAGAAVALGSAGYLGGIAGAAVWTRALSATEATLDYGGAQPKSSLAARWALREGGGTTTADDVSAGNTLTLGSGSSWTADPVWYGLRSPALLVLAPGAQNPTVAFQDVNSNLLSAVALDGQNRSFALRTLTGWPTGIFQVRASVSVQGGGASFSPYLTLHLSGYRGAQSTAVAQIARGNQIATIAIAHITRSGSSVMRATAVITAVRTAATYAQAHIQAPRAPTAQMQASAAIGGTLSSQDQTLLSQGLVRVVGRLIGIGGQPLAGWQLSATPHLPPYAAAQAPAGSFLVPGAGLTTTTAADGTFTLILPQSAQSVPGRLQYRLEGPQGLRWLFHAPAYPATICGGPVGAWQTPTLRTVSGALARVDGSALVGATLALTLDLPQHATLPLPDGSLLVNTPLALFTGVGGVWSASVVAPTIGHATVQARVQYGSTIAIV